MVIRVQADWDDEARVWGIWSDDVPGLHIEAASYDDIERKAVAAISDLAEFSPTVAALGDAPLVINATRTVVRAA